MSEAKKSISDDELLADAIPIPFDDEDDGSPVVAPPPAHDAAATRPGFTPVVGSSKIRTFENMTAVAAHEWKRRPVGDGKGAVIGFSKVRRLAGRFPSRAG